MNAVETMNLSRSYGDQPALDESISVCLKDRCTCSWSEPNIMQLISSLFGGDSESNVKPLTVGDLYQVTCNMRERAASSHSERAPARRDAPGNA